MLTEHEVIQIFMNIKSYIERKIEGETHGM